jgi:hypothetical protein
VKKSLFLVLVVLIGLATVGVLSLLGNISERKLEARESV